MAQWLNGILKFANAFPLGVCGYFCAYCEAGRFPRSVERDTEFFLRQSAGKKKSGNLVKIKKTGHKPRLPLLKTPVLFCKPVPDQHFMCIGTAIKQAQRRIIKVVAVTD